ncbi:UNVERIFIED_CONTAM: hypothetical protein Scaly_2354700 [Sesamum calycinum]|uniref:Enhancer of polycomb-like protein n=1 Tax=Sesamum calycinum TaxID=2727403 RepID=A0AAW2M1I0_9LAMI
MESSRKKSDGVEIPKRNRSLDLKSLYESRVSKLGESRKKVSGEKNHEDVKEKKRKSRKEAPLSCFEPDAKKSRKEDVNGVQSELGFGQNSSGRSKGLHGVSLTLGDTGNAFNIPKRPRGSLGRKKLVSDQVSASLKLPDSVDGGGAFKDEVIKTEDEAGASSEAGPSDRLVRSVTLSTDNNGALNSKSVGKFSGSKSKSRQKTDSKSTVNSSCSNVKLKQKVGADEVKENRNGQPGSVRHTAKEYNVVVNNGDMLPKKRQSKSRKKKELVGGVDDGEASMKKSEPSVGSSVSAKKKPSVSQTADGFSFQVSSACDTLRRQPHSLVGESAAAYDRSRTLRPRREDKGKGMSRKRRHFYEIRPRDLEPCWVLNRRIKIFWPLDESWYYGLVNDYHSESKLHHIKYDDRDEEWVNLQEEKFKLLLLPSEFPGKMKSRKLSTRVKDLHKGQTVPPADDDSCTGNHLDSEPIASWLASQSQRVKSLPKSSKRQRTSQQLMPLGSSLSSERTENSNSDVTDSKITRNKSDYESASVDNIAARGTDGETLQGAASSSQRVKHVVYVRKKYHKRNEGECTFDNIKELECGSIQQCKQRAGLNLPSSEGFKKKLVPGILPMSFPGEASNTRMSQSAFTLAAKPGKVPQFALSFSAAPTFFLTLHLQLLMEHSFAWFNLQHEDALCSLENSVNGDQLVAECSHFEASSVAVQGVPAEPEIRKMDAEDLTFQGLESCQQDLGMDVILESNAVEDTNSSEKLQKGKSDNDGTACCLKEFTEITPEVIAQPCPYEPMKEVHEQIVVSAPVSVASPTCNPRSDSTSGGMTVEIPSLEHVNVHFDGKSCISRQTSGVVWNIHDGFVHNPNPAGSRSSSQRGRISLISSPLGHRSPVWPDGNPNFVSSGLSNGPKKPRTQVQYTLPFVGYDFSAKQKMQNLRSLPCKRIRRASLKRTSDGSVNNQKNLELLTCVANILVTHGDKGWRECGANIVLEHADHNEWRLAVKLSGGGKDWVLEFPDRNQWILFKEMHEECYNRNIRAASVKNIPIPGVRLVEEMMIMELKSLLFEILQGIFRQVQTDVEMAMDPSRILYDMDSDDEQWLMLKKNCTEKHKYEKISEEVLEKAIDIFEKVSYAKLRDNFTDAEIEEFLIGIGSAEAAKVIYEHWRQKRKKFGMPLIRHLQPPLWERYQQRLKEWERTAARGNCAFSVGSQDKVTPPEKPPMFAFCLKPRGLDVPNKGSKQRSHRKFSVSGPPIFHGGSGQPSFFTYYQSTMAGRRSNGNALEMIRRCMQACVHDPSDVSPSFQASTTVLSPRDAHFSLSSNVSEWKVDVPQPRTTGNKNGVQQWNMGLPELPSRHYFGALYRQGIEQLNGSDLHEFRLRDASGAAQHALNLAKLKREKAQRLLYRADLAIHKAVVALMTAEAMKDSAENSNGVN